MAYSEKSPSLLTNDHVRKARKEIRRVGLIPLKRRFII